MSNKRIIGMRKTIIKITALFFFLIVQCYGSFFMWFNHPGPLGLDDAGWYISPITFFKENPFFFLTGVSLPNEPAFNLNKILFPYTFGVLAHLTNLSAEQMFEVNFYIGILLMGIAIYKLSQRIDPSPTFVSTSLFIFAFYSGTGYYHGFFWIVPSFYSILLFLTLLITLFSSKYKHYFSPLILLLLIITHSMGVYLAIIALSAFFIHDVFIKRNHNNIVAVSILIGLLLIVFIFGEYLHFINLVPYSFSSSVYFYGKSFNIENPKQIFDEIINTITRYRFTKYFYGIFTPLLMYGIYQFLKHKLFIPPILVFLLLAGQLILSPFTEHSYRFFYPLEILIWIVISYGISNLITILFRKSNITSIISHSVLSWSLAALSLLFLYDSIHSKVDREYSFKYYHPIYFNKEAFQRYLSNNSNSKIIIFTNLRDYYKSIEGVRQNPNIEIVWKSELPRTAISTKKLIIIGENKKYYDNNREGFQIFFPGQSKIVLHNIGLNPGVYSVELFDSGILDPKYLHIAKQTSQWKTTNINIKIPDKNLYPTIMLPWYMFADTPWPLYKRPHLNHSIQRESTIHALDFSINTRTDKLFIINSSNSPLYFQGKVIIKEKDTGKKIWQIDLDRHSRETIEEKCSLLIENRPTPLLWTDPQLHRDYSIKFFCLEKSFGDVKAFIPYFDPPALCQ